MRGVSVCGSRSVVEPMPSKHRVAGSIPAFRSNCFIGQHMPRPDYRSTEAQAYRAWYKLKLWAHKPTGLRWQCLLASLFTCKQCGWQAQAHETHKLVADHIIPHRGDWTLFTDNTNHQCLCETCHSSAKQQEERIGYSTQIGTDGFPIDPMHPANREGGIKSLGPSS